MNNKLATLAAMELNRLRNEKMPPAERSRIARAAARARWSRAKGDA